MKYSQTIRAPSLDSGPPSPNVEVDLNNLLAYIFPNDLQHPLAAARLFIYCENGPLIDNQLRSGPGRSHVLAIWELDSMCMNVSAFTTIF